MNSTLSSLNDALPHRDIVSSDCDASSTDSYINFISLEGKIYGQFVIITQIRFKVLYNMTISNDFKRIVRLNLPSSLYYAYGFYVMISYIANASNKLRLVVDGTSIGIYGLYGDPATISAGTYSNTETGYFTYR